MSINYSSPDLTLHPPRSPRVRLGGYVILPRALDKGRATVGGKNGEYHYNCPLDQRLLSFAGIDAEKLLEQLKEGKNDAEIIEWVKANSSTKPTPWAIAQWSAFQENLVYGSVEGRKRVAGQIEKINPKRDDIITGFDLLDLDDYDTFGGKA